MIKWRTVARVGWAGAVALYLCGLGQFAHGQQSPSQTASPDASPPAPQGFWDRSNLTGDWDGLRTRLQDGGVTFGLQEQSEGWGNLAGGVHQGVAYDGLTTASVSLDLERLLGWTGATIFASAYQIHGRGPTGTLVGNLQTVSSVEATPGTKLYQLYLEQKLWDGRIILRAGQEGANDQMMISQYAALYENSSFGFPPLMALSLPSGGPNYPLATPFVRVQVQATEQVTLVGAVFNDDPARSGTGNPQGRDAGGTAFRLSGHALSFGELWYSVNQGDDAPGLPGTYKLGAWYDSGNFSDQYYDASGQSLASPTSTGLPRRHSGDYAFYGVVDQLVWRDAARKAEGIGVFLQAIGAPADRNLSNIYVQGGLNWLAPFAGRDNDTLGLAVAYLGISPALRHYGDSVIQYTGQGTAYARNETVIELTYAYQVTPWWTLQPDLQMIINPGANIPSPVASKPLKNDVITGIRATIVF